MDDLYKRRLTIVVIPWFIPWFVFVCKCFSAEIIRFYLFDTRRIVEFF